MVCATVVFLGTQLSFGTRENAHLYFCSHRESNPGSHDCEAPTLTTVPLVLRIKRRSLWYI